MRYDAADRLEPLFGSKTRARLLEILLGSPERRFYVRELIRLVGAGASSVQRELESLEALGLVYSEREGRTRFFRAAPESALAAPLTELIAAEAKAAYATRAEAVADAAAGDAAPHPLAARVNRHVAPFLGRIEDACRRHHVAECALFGSSTETEPDVTPRDLDVLVRFEDAAEPVESYFGLLQELERIMGMPVDVVEEPAVRNPYLLQSLDATKVVLYAAA